MNNNPNSTQSTDVVIYRSPSSPEQLTKLTGHAEIITEARARREIGRTVVWVNGCFDLLHIGHLRLLQNAAALGDFLIVGMNSDASVKRMKGESRPIYPQVTRAEMLAALECVDLVTIIEEGEIIPLIESIQPHCVARGLPRRQGPFFLEPILKRHGGKLVVFSHIDEISTTHLIQRLRA